MVKLHIPTKGELEFRRKLYSDPATMQNFDEVFDFDESKWDVWYKRWIGHEPQRFYAYIQNEKGEFVGDVNWHFVEAEAAYYIGVVVKSEFRARGYAEEGLKLLIKRAETKGITELRNIFPAARISAKNLHEKLGFNIISTEKIDNQDIITLSKTLLVKRENDI